MNKASVVTFAMLVFLNSTVVSGWVYFYAAITETWEKVAVLSVSVDQG